MRRLCLVSLQRKWRVTFALERASQSKPIPFQDDQGYSPPDCWAAKFADYVPNSAMLVVSKCNISGKTKWTKQQATLIGPTLMCLPDPCRGASYWTRACSLEWLLNPNALWYGLHRLSVQVWVCDESKSSCGLLKKVNLPQWVHGCVDVHSSRRQQVLWIKMREMVQGAQAGEAAGQNPKWIIMLTVQLPYSSRWLLWVL